MSRAIVGALTCLSLAACNHVGGAGGASGGPPLDAEIHVGGLKADDQAHLEEQLCGLGGVLECTAKKRGRDTVYQLRYQGSLSSLQSQIASFPHPGLEARERARRCATVEVVAIDKNGNKPVENRSLFGGGRPGGS